MACKGIRRHHRRIAKPPDHLTLACGSSASGQSSNAQLSELEAKLNEPIVGPCCSCTELVHLRSSRLDSWFVVLKSLRSQTSITFEHAFQSMTQGIAWYHAQGTFWRRGISKSSSIMLMANTIP